jgi:hypothetical protein
MRRISTLSAKRARQQSRQLAVVIKQPVNSRPNKCPVNLLAAAPAATAICGVRISDLDMSRLSWMKANADRADFNRISAGIEINTNVKPGRLSVAKKARYAPGRKCPAPRGCNVRINDDDK